MQRLGSQTRNMRDFCDDDIFISRLQLLIIMGKAFLKGYPIGKHRKDAIIENAQEVFYMSLHKASAEKASAISQSNDSSDKETDSNHIFHQQVQLFAVMTKALAEGRLTESSKMKDLKNCIDHICEAITFSSNIQDMELLKVA